MSNEQENEQESRQRAIVELLSHVPEPTVVPAASSQWVECEPSTADPHDIY